VISGIVPIVVALLVQAWRARLRGGAVSWAIGLTLVMDTLAIMGGGSYWLHYLIQPAPMLALAVGRWAPRWRVLRAAGVLTVVSAMVATLGTAAVATTHDVDDPDETGTWVAQAARPGDTATMLFGHAEVQLATGLPSPYPYLWTLPMRTLDPRLAQLSALLRGPDAPTWAVGWKTLNPWQIDAHGQLTRALAQHYRLVRMVCGHHVWLHDGVHRTLPPDPACPHRIRVSRP
jgi:hypothetical protein